MNLIKKILTRLSLSFKRFPTTILLSTSLFGVLIAISETNYKNDTLSKVAMTIALGLPLSLCIKLWFEKTNEKNNFKLITTYIIGVFFLAIYYILFLKDFGLVSITRYIAVSMALYLVFLFIPFFPKRENFEMYTISIIKGFFITVVYSLVLYLGLSAILFTINKLLLINILGKIYYYTFLFVVFIFAVSYFLSQISINSSELNSNSYPKPLRILILYIVMPLLTVYTIILYIYFSKIIITSNWPIGLVSHLVLWYSVVVVMVLFFITPIKENSQWSNKFMRFFPKVIIPLLLMMFLSIGIRINAYGVTERRYYVVILALWIFFIMLYFSFSKKLRNIIIPITLSIVAIISVFGPLSSYSVSKISQNNRLEKILIKNNMIKDNKLQINSNISKEDKEHINSILSFFKSNYSLKDVKVLPENFKIEDMDKTFGFSYEATRYNYDKDYYNFTRNSSENPIDIKGYDYFFDMRAFNAKSKSTENFLSAFFDNETATFKLTLNGNDVYKKDLNSFVRTLTEKHISEGKENSLPMEAMTLVEENEKVKIKFIFLNISTKKEASSETIVSNGIEFYVLIKVK